MLVNNYFNSCNNQFNVCDNYFNSLMNYEIIYGNQFNLKCLSLSFFDYRKKEWIHS